MANPISTTYRRHKYYFCGLLTTLLLFVACSSEPPPHTADIERVDTMIVPASPEKGFYYPYILRFPTHRPGRANRHDKRYILVEPNNTGTVSDDFNEHLRAAQKLAETGVGPITARSLGLPLLIPVFSRPASIWETYTHLLDRDALLASGELRRMDLQLLAMRDDARTRLMRAGIETHEKMLMTGFSASGAFVNRFAMLHPTETFAVATGAVNGLLMLPLENLDGATLPYPLGVADYNKLVGKAFSLRDWRRVHQFIYMGSEDDNDAIKFDDGYTDQERSIIYRVIGERMLPERWLRCQAIYARSTDRVAFMTYANVGHWTNQAIHRDIEAFFAKLIGGDTQRAAVFQ